jgi:hypothetical protein
VQIKKHENKNEYCLSKSGHWVRNFTKNSVKPIDINDLIVLEDAKLILNNEMRNNGNNYQSLAGNDTMSEKVLIIGDGYRFEENLKLVEALPSDVTIIGINGAFAKWNSNRRLNYYVVNNPYNECLYYFPQVIRSWPKCIASIRTNPVFLENFKNMVLTYTPVLNSFYSGVDMDSTHYIDDYRNSACAALGVAHKLRARKILLVSLLEAYEHERPGMVKVKDLWIYPQQKVLHSLIEANLYWLQKAKIDISYMDSGLDYDFATYIDAEGLKRYFNDR